MIIGNGFEVIECTDFSCVKYVGDYWFTQKTISQIIKTTPQNITLHLREIYKFKNENEGCLIFPINKIEGARVIKRKSKHYNLDNFYDIAVRSKRFEEFNGALTKISQGNKVNFDFKVSPIKERNFKEILEKALKGIEEFHYQYTISGYRVDFFFPRLGLIVEFDEDDHKNKLSADTERQNIIERETSYHFIRVDEGEELEGLNSILLFKESVLACWELHCLELSRNT